MIALYSAFPRYFIETIVVTGILIIFVIITLGNDNPQNVIPVLSLFGIAAIRLMPSLNRMLAAVNTIRFYAPTVKTVYSDIYEFQNNEEIEKKRKQNNAYDSNRFPFYKSLEFKNIDYTYPEREEKALNNISLIIPKASSVGFVGASGAGKTTLVNITLGLLSPIEGSLFVDGQDIFSDLSAWQRMIGYVPQSVYLIDDTIRRNIAIGLPDNKIVEDKVWQVLRSVQLEDMVKNLPDGLDAVVGEQGMRLSGGQLQRVGIARALYRDPEVLIFDEATSSLDRETEASITEAIEGLGGEKTMIIIAHRMKTVENCDCLYFLEKGEITASGSYSELLEKSTEFRKMTGETN